MDFAYDAIEAQEAAAFVAAGDLAPYFEASGGGCICLVSSGIYFEFDDVLEDGFVVVCTWHPIPDVTAAIYRLSRRTALREAVTARVAVYTPGAFEPQRLLAETEPAEWEKPMLPFIASRPSSLAG